MENGRREAVIIGGLRTPFGRRGGQLAGWHPVELLSFTLKGLIERTDRSVRSRRRHWRLTSARSASRR